MCPSAPDNIKGLREQGGSNGCHGPRGKVDERLRPALACQAAFETGVEHVVERCREAAIDLACSIIQNLNQLIFKAEDECSTHD